MTQTVVMNDKELQANVTNELSYDPSIDATHLVVLADDGVVTLSGEVASLPERRAARRAALRVIGTTAIADDMVVRDPGTAATTDSDLADAAKQMLNWAADVPAKSVTASVHNHKITLSGTVNWQYQREAATRAVMYLRGITALTNSISLTPAAPASDAKTELKAAILRNARLDSHGIVVDVNNGEVTLRGTVGSLADRRQAEYLAWSAPGVTSVTNHLAITS